MDNRLSLFLPSDNECGYIQVVAKDSDKEQLLSLGWFKSPDDFRSSSEQPASIDDFDNKDNLELFVLELTNNEVDIDKRGSVESVKKKAKEAVEEWKQQVQ